MRISELFATYRTRVLFLIRYGVSGVIGGVIQVVFLYVWVSGLGFEETYLLGLCLGFVAALVAAFGLQKYWAFRDNESSRMRGQLLSYSVVAVSGLALNALLLTGAKLAFVSVGVDFFQGWYLLAQTVVVGIVSVFNFAMNFIFTFRHARRHKLWDV